MKDPQYIMWGMHKWWIWYWQLIHFHRIVLVSILPPLVEYKIFTPSNVFDHFNVKCIDLIHAGIVSKGYMNLLIVEQKYVEKKL